MARVLLEVCVDSLSGLEAALAGGADRIELCAALEVGGLTPSAGLMRAAAGCGLPVMAMIRPRAGDFAFSGADVAVMIDDIVLARETGLTGVVLGAMQGRALDLAALATLCDAAVGLDKTLHRAVDLCQDRLAALDLAVALGFGRVLTSGGAASAPAGDGAIRAMVAHARGRMSVMPGGGISPANAGVFRQLGVTEIHASCSDPGSAMPLGMGAPRLTSAARVRALKAELLTWG